MKKLILAVMAAILVLPALALAAPSGNIIYTWGGIDALEQSYRQLSEVIYSPEYASLKWPFMALGLFVAGFIAIWSNMHNPGIKSLTWIFPTIIGFGIWGVVFGSSVDVLIYDESLNQLSQGSIKLPAGIYRLKKATNQIESIFLDAIQRAAAARSDASVSYKATGGGLGLGVIKHPGTPSGNYAATLQIYWHDCVVFESLRPGGEITADEIASTTDLAAVLKKAASPSIYTTVPLLANSNDPQTCEQSWAAIEAATTADNNMIAAICQANGFKDLATCKIVTDATLAAAGVQMTTEQYGAWAVMSETIYQSLVTDKGNVAATQTNKTLVAAGMGAIAADNQWITTARYATEAIFISILPFMSLMLLIGPLWKKSLLFIIGIITFSMVNTIVDASIYQMITNRLADMFGEANLYGQGLKANLLYPSAAEKVLSFMGIARAGTLTITTAICSALGLVSAHAFGQLATSLAGQIGAAGQAAGQVAYTPEGRSAAIGAAVQAPGNMANASRWNSNELISGTTNAATWSTAQNLMGAKNLDAHAAGAGLDQKGFAAAISNSSVTMATDKGQLSMTRDAASGKVVQSNLTSGHTETWASQNRNQATTNYLAGNMGNMTASASETVQDAARSALGRARSESNQMQESFVKSGAASWQESESFAKSAAANESLSESTRKGLTDTMTTEQRAAETLSNRLVKEHGLSKDKANAIATNTAVAGKAGAALNLDKLTFGIVNFSAGAETSRSGSNSNSSTAGESNRNSVADDISKLYAASKASSHAVTVARDEAYSKGLTTTATKADNVTASWQQTQSKSEAYSQSVALTDTLSDTYEHAKTDAASFSYDTSAMIKTKLGDKAHEIIAGANNPAGNPAAKEQVAAVKSAHEDVIKDISSDFYKDAVAKVDRKLADKVDGGLAAGEKLTEAPATGIPAAGSARIDSAANEAGVKDSITAPQFKAPGTVGKPAGLKGEKELSSGRDTLKKDLEARRDANGAAAAAAAVVNTTVEEQKSEFHKTYPNANKDNPYEND